MPQKRATFYSYGDDSNCTETKSFIEEAGYILNTRDISKSKLSYDELNKLIGHVSIKHFLNQLSSSYSKNKLDKELPGREEILKLMAEDYTLLRTPIIKTARLVTVGCNQKRIMEMLQITLTQEPSKEVDGNVVTTRSAHSNVHTNNHRIGSGSGSSGRSSGKPMPRSNNSGKSSMKSGARSASASK